MAGPRRMPLPWKPRRTYQVKYEELPMPDQDRDALLAFCDFRLSTGSKSILR
jgi:hypothetical protein